MRFFPYFPNDFPCFCSHHIPSGELTQQLEMAIEIVDFPIKNGNFPLLC